MIALGLRRPLISPEIPLKSFIFQNPNFSQHSVSKEATVNFLDFMAIFQTFGQIVTDCFANV